MWFANIVFETSEYIYLFILLEYVHSVNNHLFGSLMCIYINYSVSGFFLVYKVYFNMFASFKTSSTAGALQYLKMSRFKFVHSFLSLKYAC